MHDTLGGRMAGLVLLAKRKSPEIAEHLQSSLNDLRSIMDTLQANQPLNLEDAIHNFQAGLTPWLHSHNLTSQWHVSVDPHTSLSEAHQQTWLTSLFQGLHEVVNNSVQHANAQSMQFSFIHNANQPLHITITDNGIGIEDIAAALAKNRGLAGLKLRIYELGGSLSVNSGQGFTVIIILPLP